MSFRQSSLQSGKQERDAELAEVEEVLAAVCEGIDKLEEESREAKKEIAEVFSRQLTHLHSRQTQLLRQVDIVCRSRGELLHSQLAHTHRLLGALQTTHRWTEKLQQHKSDLTTQIISNLKKGTILSSLNLSLDEEALNAAIAGFGYVDMDGIFLMGGAEKSRCLPASVEEYLEDDQNVMEKSLHSNIIDMKFPKLPKDYTYWLSCNKKKEDQPATETGYGPYRKALDSYKPCNVQTWLGCIQNETAAEPVDQAGDFSPELVSLSDSVSLCSSKQSDSIEIVSTCSLKSDEEKVDKCCQKPLINVEIENLAEKLSVCMTDKQRWLAPTRTKPIVETMCRANELCKPDEKCLFENNCDTIKLSPQHKNQTNKTDNQDFRKWLRPKPSTPSLAQAVRPPPPSNDDYTKWLRPAASSKIKDDVNEQLKKNNVPVKRPMLPALSGHSWLRSKKPMISLNATTPVQLNKTTPDEWHRWLSRID